MTDLVERLGRAATHELVSDEIALEAATNIEEHTEKIRVLREALEMARNGLAWYRDSFPQVESGCDDEAQAQIDAALEQTR